MRVTELKREKGHIYRVFFDGSYEVLLDTDVVSEHSVKVNSSFSESEIEEIKQESDYVRAKSRAMFYLDRAERTEKGLYDKLVSAGFEKTACAKVLARLKELGLVDDKRFAENLRDRLLSANASKRQIYYKLTEKGINKDLANETLAYISSDEKEKIKNLIDKKYKRKLTDKNSVSKVYAALVRKGFSYGDVRDALKQYEEELIGFDGDM